MEKFDTIITGAGISRAGPSNLPGGIDLARSLWRKLYRSLEDERIEEISESAELLLFPEKREAKRKGLRLEGICDVLSRYISFDEIKKAYEAVGISKYNFNHAALVRLYPSGQLTLNLDTLLEEAGKANGISAPIHLHGIWNQPDTIITTIGQYLGGLPERAYKHLAVALRHKRVLVLGYGGADVDVFPLFEQYPPKYIEWIQYYKDEFEPEVADWKTRVEKKAAASLNVRKTSAQEYLREALVESGLMDNALQLLYMESIVSTDAAPKIPESLFALTPLHERLMGISAILLEIGMCKEAVEVLEMIPKSENRIAMIRDMLMARGYKRMLIYDKAFDLLTQSGGHRLSIKRVWQNATEIVSLLPHLQKKSRMAYIANTVMIWGIESFRRDLRLKKAEYLARVRRAKLNIFSGRLKRALRDFQFLDQYPENELMKLIGVGSFVDAVSWRADILKMTGQYKEALDSLRKLENTVSIYSNVNQHAFVYYKLAEVQLLAGLDEDEAISYLERANAYLALNSKENPDGKKAGLLPVWILSAYGDVHALKHTMVVKEALTEAQTYTNPNGDRYGGTIYYLLHMAERARVEKEYDQCISLIEQVLILEKDKNTLPRGYLSERAAAYHIMGMCICDRCRAAGKPAPIAGMGYLRKALTCYRKMGMESGAARIEISIAETQERSISSENVHKYNEAGWKLEAERAVNPLKYQSEAWVILA